MDLKAYPKIHNLGYRGFEGIFNLPVIVQEKLDGSNVSIHRTADGLRLASRTQWIGEKSPGDAGMFSKFASWVHRWESCFLEILPVGYTIWGEFCNNHNVLQYDRTTPFAMFDLSITDTYGNRKFVPPLSQKITTDLIEEFDMFLVPSIVYPDFPSKDEIEKLLQFPSLLGGKREGIVFKNYDEYAILGGVPHEMFAKYVNPEYKETHKVVYNQGEPIEETIVKAVYTEARLRKGIARLREEARCVNGPQDIGPLIGILNQDIYRECSEEIKSILFDRYWKGISRIITGKVVKDYKAILQAQNNPRILPESGPGVVSDAGGKEITSSIGNRPTAVNEDGLDTGVIISSLDRREEIREGVAFQNEKETP